MMSYWVKWINLVLYSFLRQEYNTLVLDDLIDTNVVYMIYEV